MSKKKTSEFGKGHMINKSNPFGFPLHSKNASRVISYCSYALLDHHNKQFWLQCLKFFFFNSRILHLKLLKRSNQLKWLGVSGHERGYCTDEQHGDHRLM